MADKNEIRVVLGGLLAASKDALEKWPGKKAADLAETGAGTPSEAESAGLAALEKVFRIARSRAGSAAQNALLAALKRASAGVADQGSEFVGK